MQELFRNVVIYARTSGDLAYEIRVMESTLLKNKTAMPGCARAPVAISDEKWRDIAGVITDKVKEGGCVTKYMPALFKYSENCTYTVEQRHGLAEIIFAKHGKPPAGGAVGSAVQGDGGCAREVVPVKQGAEASKVTKAMAGYELATGMAAEKEVNVKNAQDMVDKATAALEAAQRKLTKAQKELESAVTDESAAEAKLEQEQADERAAKRFKRSV
jgi:hypothetical protein